VKTQVLAALTALMAVASLGAPVQAQAQGNPAGANAVKYGVAVVDINYIFKNHAKFIASMDGMKTDFQAVETDVKGKQQQIMQAQEQQKTFAPGSPEFKQLDEQIVRMTAGLQVDVTQKRKELVDREAKIYYDTYVEVTNTIKLYAEHKGIGMVLRFNGEDADPNNRESILRAINKAVHFQNSIDITPDVLAYLNRSETAARPAAGGAQAAPR
jgi:Skp family chaperone for outer membrane proteins